MEMRVMEMRLMEMSFNVCVAAAMNGASACVELRDSSAVAVVYVQG